MKPKEETVMDLVDLFEQSIDEREVVGDEEEKAPNGVVRATGPAHVFCYDSAAYKAMSQRGSDKGSIFHTLGSPAVPPHRAGEKLPEAVFTPPRLQVAS